MLSTVTLLPLNMSVFIYNYCHLYCVIHNYLYFPNILHGAYLPYFTVFRDRHVACSQGHRIPQGHMLCQPKLTRLKILSNEHILNTYSSNAADDDFRSIFFKEKIWSYTEVLLHITLWGLVDKTALISYWLGADLATSHHIYLWWPGSVDSTIIPYALCSSEVTLKSIGEI